MEVTTWLKPSGNSCHEIRWQRECAGRNASECRASLEKVDVRVDLNALSGKTDTAAGLSKYERSRRTGVLAAACTQGKRAQHGKPLNVVGDDQPDAGDGQAGHFGVADRPVVPTKPGNAGGGKGPWFKTDATSGKGQGIGKPMARCHVAGGQVEPLVTRMGELLPSRYRQQSVPGDRQLHGSAAEPVVA